MRGFSKVFSNVHCASGFKNIFQGIFQALSKEFSKVFSGLHYARGFKKYFQRYFQVGTMLVFQKDFQVCTKSKGIFLIFPGYLQLCSLCWFFGFQFNIFSNKSSFSSFVAHVGEKKLVMFVAFFCPPGGGASLSSIRVEKVCRHLLAAAGQVVADGCFGPTRSQPASLLLIFALPPNVEKVTHKREKGKRILH